MNVHPTETKPTVRDAFRAAYAIQNVAMYHRDHMGRVQPDFLIHQAQTIIDAVFPLLPKTVAER